MQFNEVIKAIILLLWETSAFDNFNTLFQVEEALSQERQKLMADREWTVLREREQLQQESRLKFKDMANALEQEKKQKDRLTLQIDQTSKVGWRWWLLQQAGENKARSTHESNTRPFTNCVDILTVILTGFIRCPITLLPCKRFPFLESETIPITSISIKCKKLEKTMWLHLHSNVSPYA